jgi:hypothetical protein
MAGKYFLPGIAPLIADLPLASFVPNLQQPDQDAFSPESVGRIPQQGKDYTVRIGTNLGRFMSSAKSTVFKAEASKLLFASFEKKISDTHWLEACKVRCYTLKNPKQLFNELVKKEETREWLQSEIEYGTSEVYFIVGYYTAQEAKLHVEHQQSSQAAIGGRVPVGEIITAGGAALIAAVANMDVGGEVSHGSQQNQKVAVHTSDERILAFAHRKVGFRIFTRKKKVDTAKLEADNCWTLTSDNRGGRGEQDDEVVELDFGDNDEAGDEGFEIPEMGTGLDEELEV